MEYQELSFYRVNLRYLLDIQVDMLPKYVRKRSFLFSPRTKSRGTPQLEITIRGGRGRKTKREGERERVTLGRICESDFLEAKWKNCF